jgi:hypothetical protein
LQVVIFVIGADVDRPTRIRGSLGVGPAKSQAGIVLGFISHSMT